MTTNSTSASDAHPSPMTDRRAFLAAAPALAVLTAGPAFAAAPNGDPASDECVEACVRSDAAIRAHYKARLGPAEKAFFAAREAVPHYTTKASVELAGERIHFTTADPFHRSLAHNFGPKEVGDGCFAGCAGELLGAVNEREAKIATLRHECQIEQL